MGKDTKIPWANATFNSWWGCAKISSGCKFCYANNLAKRWGHDVWGKDKPRKMMSESYWKQPLKWNREARESGVPRRVFCGSMCDIMEDHKDVHDARVRLWRLIAQTPHLTWLLLTKRPENFNRFLPPEWKLNGCPKNVWVGATVENQSVVEDRCYGLSCVGAVCRFVSCEPMLESIDLGNWLKREIVKWVICGAESGPNRREFQREWARDLRDQCLEHDTPFFYKQEISETGKKIETPLLDGRRWMQFPGRV